MARTLDLPQVHRPGRIGPTRLPLPWWAGRVALLCVAAVVAYWLSLATLWRDLGGQTPLAMIGLAPILAIALLGAGLARRSPLRPPGRIDLLVGGALIAAAAAIVLVGPAAASVYFWVARLDILSLPLFVSGALLALFGWRVLFVSRAALVLLLLSWPLPSMVLVENSAEALTTITSDALAAVVAIVPIAAVVEGTAGSFIVAYAPDPFMVQVATACAGMNSTVAFLLVGGAFGMFIEGRVPAKLAWLGLGMLLVFALNVIRVIALVAIGAMFGPVAALEVFHPFAGLAALGIGLLIMIRLLPRFGLRPPALRPAAPQALPAPGDPLAISALMLPGARPNAHTDAMQPASPAAMRRGPRLLPTGSVLLAVAALFGAVNGTFAAYEEGENTAVAAPLTPRTAQGGSEPGPSGPASAEVIADRTVIDRKDITIGRPYFGTDSTWTRYRLVRPVGAPARDRYSLWLDVITVTDRQRLVDFGVEDCYRFHGQAIDASQSVSLGGGVVARIVETKFSKGGRPWLVLWWERPVDVRGAIHHERVVLLAPATATPTDAPVELAEGPLVLDLGTAVPEAHRALANDLVRLGSEIAAAGSGRQESAR